jgi:hypothetical protein
VSACVASQTRSTNGDSFCRWLNHLYTFAPTYLSAAYLYILALIVTASN